LRVADLKNVSCGISFFNCVQPWSSYVVLICQILNCCSHLSNPQVRILNCRNTV